MQQPTLMTTHNAMPMAMGSSIDYRTQRNGNAINHNQYGAPVPVSRVAFLNDRGTFALPNIKFSFHVVARSNTLGRVEMSVGISDLNSK